MGIASASDAIAVYRSDSYVGATCPGDDVNCPRIRFWDSASDAWGSEIVLQSSGSEVKWAIVKASPVSDKIIVVTQSTGGSTSYDKLTGYVCMSGCDNAGNWAVTTNLATVSNTGGGGGSEIEERMFDVEFETATGDAVLVYSVDSSNSAKDFGYKVLPAATSSFSSLTEYYINDNTESSSKEHKWIRMDRDPASGSQELIMAAYNPSSDYDIDAWVWSGSSWGNQEEISSSASSTDEDEALAVRYAADGSKAMVAGAYGSSGYVRYRTWSGSSWSSTGSFDSNGGSNSDVRWMNIKADPETNDLQAIIVDSGENLHTAYWNGAGWNVESNIDSSIDTDSRRSADFEWNPTGSTGILVWDTDGSSGNSLHKMTCDPECDNSPSSTSSYSGEGRWITLYRNPTAADDVNILGLRMRYYCWSCGYHCTSCSDALGAFSFDGSSYSNYGDGTLTWEPESTTYESYSVAFVSMEVANVSVVKVDQTAEQPSPGGTVEFNITVTNSGSVTLDPVEVVDTLPSGLTYSASSPAAAVNGQILTWDVGPLASGASATILINATVDQGVVDENNQVEYLYNNVEVTGVPTSGNNVTSQDSAEVTVYYADISVIKVDVTPVLTSPGGTVQWLINITNTGSVPLTTVHVSDTLPAGFAHSGADPAADSVNGQVINWTIGPIASGGYEEILLNSTVGSGVANGTYSNIVDVVGTPLNGNNVTDSDSANVGIFAPGINVVKSASRSLVEENEKVGFTLNITNTGSIELNVTVQDTFPASIKLNQADPAPSSVNGHVTWEIELAVGESKLIHYNVSSNRSGLYTNNVTVTGMPPNGDNVTDNDSAVFRVEENDDPNKKNMDLAIVPSCDTNVVTVSRRGDPINGARVAIIDVNGSTIAIGDTGADGTFEFNACSMTVKVHVSKTGYFTEEEIIDLIACGECEPQCLEDVDCPSGEYCDDGQCVSISCECGEITGHECVEYSCCNDEQCENGVCVNNQCVPETECDTDDDCDSAEYCNTDQNCEPVTGSCGYPENHEWQEYDCGDEEECPECQQGYACVDHQCVQGDIQCPPTTIGEDSDCNATEGDGPCRNCDYMVTDPAGKTSVGTTDGDGKFRFQPTMVGNYTISLVLGGDVLKSINVEAYGKGEPLELNPQEDQFDLLWLLLLALLIIIAVVAWKKRKKKPGRTMPKKK